MITSSKAISTLYKPKEENYFINFINKYILNIVNKFVYTKAKEESHVRKLEILNQLISATNSAEDLDILCAKTLSTTLYLMNFHCGAIYLVEKHKNKATIKYSESVSRHISNKINSLPTNISPFNEIYEHGIPFVSNDYNTSIYENLNSYGFQSYIIIPLIYKSEILGSLNLFSKEKVNFCCQKRELLLSIGKEVGTAINRLIIEEKINTSLREKELLLHELNIKNEELKKLSITDGLTSLYNHKFIVEKLKEEINKCKYDNSPLSIIMFDIDHFKKVNDTYGHLFGDKVLKQISKISLNLCKDTKLIGRYGGEEFLIILPNTNSMDAFKFAENLRKTIANTKWDKNNFSVTISLGIEQYNNNTHSNIIARADNLLYKAKESGRNRTCNF